MVKLTIVSADGHAAAPLPDYRPYIEQRWMPEFNAAVEHAAEVAIDFFAIMDPPAAKAWKEGLYDTGVILGRSDPDLRIKALAAEGIVAEILFPDGAPFGAGGLGSEFDRCPLDQERAGAHAYNRWLADFISGYDKQLGAQAVIVLTDDVDEAIADVQWAAERKFRGLVMPGISDDRPQVFDPRYGRLWSAIEETGLVLNYHGGIGLPTYGPKMDRIALDVRVQLAGTEYPFFAHRPLWHLIWGGVLERHPKLRVAFSEQHSDWVPAILAKLDFTWEFGRYNKQLLHSVVPHKPSFYWDRQCFVGSSVLSRHDLQAREGIGIDNMMFGADFPHPEGTCMRTLDYLQAIVPPANMSEAELRTFLAGTAIDVFGFDADYLAQKAEECGHTAEAVQTALPEERLESLRFSDVFRPAT